MARSPEKGPELRKLCVFSLEASDFLCPPLHCSSASCLLTVRGPLMAASAPGLALNTLLVKSAYLLIVDSWERNVIVLLCFPS